MSSKPLWKLANTHLPADKRFPEPPRSLSSLHRKVSGNMSRFMSDAPHQVLVAHIMMELCTVVSKQEKIFGRDQGIAGGGPYLACSRTIFRPPPSLNRHAETYVKGFCQLSKTYETCGQAFHCFFVEGVLPIIFMRNKGGASVGTADMTLGMKEFNGVVKGIFESIIGHYRHLRDFDHVKVEDFELRPRRSSEGETLEFHGNGSYLLMYPQVIIACTNVTQLEPLYKRPTSARALAANQPQLSLVQIFSGKSKAQDSGNANPYLPWVFDASELDAPDKADGGSRLLPAIAALFDEDDTNPSASGNEAKERLLFKKAPLLCERLKELQRSRAAAEELDESPGDEQDAQADRDTAEFYKEFRGDFKHCGLRASFALVIAYTATPTTAIYAIGGGASEIDVHMVELVPGKGYIGYETPRMNEIAPHLTRHVNVVALPNRTPYIEGVRLKDAYPRLFHELGLNGNQVPHPFKQTKAGSIMLPSKDKDEMVECDNGESYRAIDLKEKAKDVVKDMKPDADPFWHADGGNIKRILKDMDARKAEYPGGYRSALCMTNFTKSERGKEALVKAVLGFRGEDEYLSKGLVTIEYDYRRVRLTWLAGEIDEDVLLEAVNVLLQSDDEQAVKWARACRFSSIVGEERVAVATDDSDSDSGESDEISEAGEAGTPAAHTLHSSCPNINYCYSALNIYMDEMRARQNQRRATVASCSAAPLAQNTFLKILAFAGEIGSRGVRYKSHDHKLVLTDMYFAFNVSTSTQITAHGAGVIQSIGRLCSLVPHPERCPEIRLWIPQVCKDFCDLWLAVMDELPALYAKKQPDETFEQLLTRIATEQTPEREHDAVIQHFAAPIGYGKKNNKFFARIDHRNGKAKELSMRLEQRTIAAGTPPQPIDVIDDLAEVRNVMITQAVRRAIQQDRDVHHAGGDEGGALEDEAAFDMLAVPPQPTPVKVAHPRKKRKQQEANKDQEHVRAALKDLRLQRDALLRGDPDPSDTELMDIFSAWYRYFVFAEGEAKGLASCSTRESYWASIKRMTTPTGRRFFTSIECLPKVNTPDERRRIKSLIRSYFEDLNSGRGQTPHKKDIVNMMSHIMKMLDLFPPSTDLRYFLLQYEIPSNDGLP